jgi:hypothetical protein
MQNDIPAAAFRFSLLLLSVPTLPAKENRDFPNSPLRGTFLRDGFGRAGSRLFSLGALFGNLARDVLDMRF